MAVPSELERDLNTMTVELRRLESEYTMYFAGRSPRPPVELRAKVEALFKKWERAYIENLPLRFRLSSLQLRFHSFLELWERSMRTREEGRRVPFARRPGSPTPAGEPSPAPTPAETRHDMPPEATAAAPSPPRGERLVHATSFSDPAREADKVRALYDSLMQARRQAGEAEVSYERFADLVGKQVRALRKSGEAEVDFRVALKDGKVSLTARTKKNEGE